MKTTLNRSRIVALALIVMSLAGLQRFRKRTHRDSLTGIKVLVIGAYGNGNFGDDIVGQVIAAGIREEGGQALVAARGDDLDRLGRDFDMAHCVGGGIGGIWRTWRSARGCEVAVPGGGGLLEGRRNDVHAHRLVLEYLGKLLACGLRGQTTSIYGFGVSPNLYSSRLVNHAVRDTLRGIDAIIMKDQASQAVVDSAGATAALIRDPATVFIDQRWIRKDHPNWVIAKGIPLSEIFDLGDGASDPPASALVGWPGACPDAHPGMLRLARQMLIGMDSHDWRARDRARRTSTSEDTGWIHSKPTRQRSCVAIKAHFPCGAVCD